MSIEVYSQEQATRLTQFKRIERFVSILSTKDSTTTLVKGMGVILTEGPGRSRVVAMNEARMMVGALNGLFNELYDLGLKEAIMTKTEDGVGFEL